MFIITLEYEYVSPVIITRETPKEALKRYGELILEAKSGEKRHRRVTLFLNEYTLPRELCSSGIIGIENVH